MYITYIIYNKKTSTKMNNPSNDELKLIDYND